MKFTRRQFLGQAACASLANTSIMSTLLSLKMANKAVAQTAENATDRKTLVCLFLHGGIDSYNMLVPNDARYTDYAASRTDLALSQGSLLPLSQRSLAGGILGDSTLYGLHPSMGELQSLFNGLAPGAEDEQRRLAYITNLGTLIEPTTMAEYQSGSVQIPKALFSHSDQIEQWQTALPQGGTNLTGWAGRIADVLHDTANADKTSMSISFSGNNTFQVGNTTQQFVMTPGGALTFSDAGQSDSWHPAVAKNVGLNTLLDQEYANLMETAFVQLTESSVEQQQFVQGEFDSFDDNSVATAFPNSWLGQQLYGALKTIALREQLGLTRQTIFVSMGGWDHHSELLDTQSGMLAALSPAMSAFQLALEELGLQDSVITYTASDFGRTLRSNGRGTDHAWGGNQMVMGGPVNGGQVYGTFPDLLLDGSDDVGRGGRLLPTTPIDNLFGELLHWFGVSTTDIHTILPNYANFNPGSDLPIGFLKT